MTPIQKDIDNWPDVFDENLKYESKKKYRVRKQSITDWFAGKSISLICVEHQITRSQLYRKCL